MKNIIKEYQNDIDVFPRSPITIANIINTKFSDKKLVLYGAGTHTDEVMENLKNKENIIQIIDDNNSNYLSLKEFLSQKIEFDYIVVSSHYFAKKMENYLKNFIPNKKILNFYSFKYIDYFGLNDLNTTTIKNQYKKDTIVIIPPDGKMNNFDFTIQRMIEYFISKKKKLVLISLDDVKLNNVITIKADNLIDLYIKIAQTPKEYILYRGWMHSYKMGGILAKYYPNVIVYLKDWGFAPKKQYAFLFGKENAKADFKGIKRIFKYAKYILSHYTNKQTDKWAKKYKVDKNKFIFLPELCNNLNILPQKKRNNKLVWAGTLPPSCMPIKHYLTKEFLVAMGYLKKQRISLDIVLPPKYYEGIFNIQKDKYIDFLYENEFNKYFNLKKGKDLNPQFISNYKYGIFPLYIKDRYFPLFEYAVPSKFAFYLEANLPMIVNKEMKAVAKLVKQEKLGIVISNKDIKNLDKIIKDNEVNYNIFIKNIIRFKELFSYKNFKGFV